MSDSADLQAWVTYAEADYDASRATLRRSERFAFIAAFHPQQSAEKYFKAILIAKGKPFPKVHDLVKLNELCVEAGAITGLNIQDLNTLTEYAARTRYPGSALSPSEAKEAYGIAKIVRKFARRYLSLA